MNQRYYSLDVFRGMTVALMILVNTPGSWSYIYPPLKHAEWHGLTATDLVFPFFLFAVGNAMAFVMPKFYASADSFFWKKVIKRTILIFIIGLVLNWLPFIKWQVDDVTKINNLVWKPWEYLDAKNNVQGIRLLGVLQRIALCYFFASVIIYYCKRNIAIIIGITLLLLYWVICYFGNPTDPYSITGWVGTSIDKYVIGSPHLYKGEEIKGIKYVFDPEGLLSTIAAIVQVIFGYVIGKYIKDNGSGRQTIEKLLIAGIALTIIGVLWNTLFPINKKIWTSSYTVVTTGMGTFIIGTFIYLFELVKVPKIFGKFFDAFGKNPLFIFVLSGALPRVFNLILIPNGFTKDAVQKFTSPLGWIYENVFKNISTSDLRLGSFLYAITMILFYWLIAYLMDKKKIYVKV